MLWWQPGQFVGRASIDGAAGLSAEAQQFISRITAPSAPRKAQYATLIDALVSAGVWTKLDALYVFAAADSATALTSLVSATYNATATGAPTFTADQGFLGATNKYVDSNFNPSTAGGKFVQNSATVLGWSLTTTGIAASLVGQSSIFHIDVTPRWTDNNTYVGVNSTATIAVASTDGSGCWLATRRASNAVQAYKNGVSIGTASTASSALDNLNIHFLRGGGAAFYTGTIAAGAIGSQVSAAEQLAFYNALHTYLQAVAGVP